MKFQWALGLVVVLALASAAAAEAENLASVSTLQDQGNGAGELAQGWLFAGGYHKIGRLTRLQGGLRKPSVQKIWRRADDFDAHRVRAEVGQGEARFLPFIDWKAIEIDAGLRIKAYRRWSSTDQR